MSNATQQSTLDCLFEIDLSIDEIEVDVETLDALGLTQEDIN